jgi:hypothetical protein
MLSHHVSQDGDLLLVQNLALLQHAVLCSDNTLCCLSLMIRLYSLKELKLCSAPVGFIWISGHLALDKDQLYISDGLLKYKLLLQLDGENSLLFDRYSVCLGTSQIFKDSIIVSKLMYLNIRDVSKHYDFYVPKCIIVSRSDCVSLGSGLGVNQDTDPDDMDPEDMDPESRFVVQVQAKSEILCKGSVDFIIQASIIANDFSWLPADLSYQAQRCCVCTVFIIFHGGTYLRFRVR